jgi:hypothetical protein
LFRLGRAGRYGPVCLMVGAPFESLTVLGEVEGVADPTLRLGGQEAEAVSGRR